MLQEALLEQTVENRIEHRWRHLLRLAGQFRKAAHDPPDHIFKALVDLQDIGAERFFEQGLRAEIVPETVQMSFIAHGLAKDLQESRGQFLVSAGACNDLIVARDATRLVMTDTA